MKNYCIDCNKLLPSRSELNPPKRCWDCRVKYLVKNATGGETKKIHYCKESNCNNKISYRSWKYGLGRCRKCAGIFRRGKRHPSYGKPSKMPNCKDCGKKLKDYRSKRCPSCSSVINIKKSFLKINPNKPEKLMDKLLQGLLPKEYKYVGNGKVILDKFCPDFININGQKKIIELYGDYWHNRPEVKERDKRRLIAYTKYGYKTLIIWEHELKDINKLKFKLKKFNY